MSLVIISNVEPKSIFPGCYVLVKILSARSNEYRYVAVCQSHVQPSGDVKVSFLELCGKDQRKIFKMREENDKLVCSTDIIRVLEDPQIKMVGDRVTYHFSKCVDVLEQ